MSFVTMSAELLPVLTSFRVIFQILTSYYNVRTLSALSSLLFRPMSMLLRLASMASVNSASRMAKRYFITTPIYYVNSYPHVGTTLTTVVADVCARYRRLRGESVYFLTGTDENGLKVAEAAEKNSKSPKEHTDFLAEEFKKTFLAMNVSFDDFIRTTEPRHVLATQRFFKALQDNGYVYKGVYEGWYDVSSETFYKEADLVDGKSPDGNEVRWVSEENWFFKLSAFEARLLKHIEDNPTFLLPVSRKNEVVSFIKQGLRDMCITRANPGWGIPMPGDDTKVVYVWFDALINYLAATGWPEGDWQSIWPADVHWMAKEIFTRFHATLWPAMLMGIGVELPRHVVAHEWFTFGDMKMSKSKGNIIEPIELAGDIARKTGCKPEISIDVVRYSLAALTPYGSDTNYTRDEVDKLYNSDLANDLGNALNRTLAMAHKFVDGKIPGGDIEKDAAEAIARAQAEFDRTMETFEINKATSAALGLVRFLNKYIDTRAPWALHKAGSPELPAVVRSMLACLRASEGLIRPIMPTVADEMSRQLGVKATATWASIGTPESLPEGTALGQPEPIFPRLEKEKVAPTAKDSKEKKKMETKETTPKAEAANTQNPTPTTPQEITIDDFIKVQLRIARIVEAEPVEGADKLMKLQVVIGQEKRQIVAGIRANYKPEELIGRQIVVVYNLKPRTMRGAESQGMVLAAVDENGGAILLSPEKEAPEGALVR
jgi:methionyl-tRNA synthetase